jgi:hypothetical protein
MAGTWSAAFSCDAPNGGDTPVNITFTQTGNNFSGTYTTGGSSWSFTGTQTNYSVKGTFSDSFGCTGAFDGYGTANQVMISITLGASCPFSGCVQYGITVTFTR